MEGGQDYDEDSEEKSNTATTPRRSSTRGNAYRPVTPGQDATLVRAPALEADDDIPFPKIIRKNRTIMTNGGRTTDGWAASHTREVPKIIYQKTATTEDLPDYVMGGGARRATFDDQTRQQMSRSVMHMFPKIHEALDPKLPGAMPRNEIDEAGSRAG